MKNKYFFTSLSLLFITFLSVVAVTSRGIPHVVSTNLEKIPMNILGLTAAEDFFSDDIYDELNADLNLYRHYRADDGRQVDLYIGYYGTAKGGRTAHNPYACLPSSGWSILKTKRVDIKSKLFPESVSLNFILSTKDGIYNSILHWYQSSGDKVLVSGIEQNVQRFVGRLLYNRNDGAFVRISCTSERDNLRECKQLIEKFAAEILDDLPLYWPVEQ